MPAKLLMTAAAISMTMTAAINTKATAETVKVMTFAGIVDYQKAGWNRILEEFHKAHPDIEIEVVAVPYAEIINQSIVQILGGTPPDVIHGVMSWIPQWNALQGGGLADLSEHIDAEIIADFPEVQRTAATYDDKLLGLVWLPGPIMMYVNRNLWNEAGVDPDTWSGDWNDFAEVIKKVCALPDRNGGKTYGVGLRSSRTANSGQWMVQVIYGFGGDIVDADGEVDFTNQGMIDAYQFYQDMVNSGCSPEGATHNDTRNLFSQGNVGVIFEGPWGRGFINSLSGDQMNVAPDGDVWVYPMPSMPDGDVRQMANDNVLVMTEASEAKDAAATFIDFVLTNEPTVAYYAETSDQVVTGYSPILENAPVFAEDPMVQAFVEWMPVSNAVPLKHPKWDAVADLMAVTMQKVIQGADPESELARAERDAQRQLRR
ncbi:MAG: sugar ABC transporter substrate-binding protein [Pseudomonadota bacterium]